MFYAFAFGLLLALLLTVLALRRPDSRRRFLRVAAGLTATAGLGLAAFPPAKTAVLPATDAAILLTDSYSLDTLRTLPSGNFPRGCKTYTYWGTACQRPMLPPSLVSDLFITPMPGPVGFSRRSGQPKPS